MKCMYKIFLLIHSIRAQYLLRTAALIVCCLAFAALIPDWSVSLAVANAYKSRNHFSNVLSLPPPAAKCSKQVSTAVKNACRLWCGQLVSNFIILSLTPARIVSVKKGRTYFQGRKAHETEEKRTKRKENALSKKGRKTHESMRFAITVHGHQRKSKEQEQLNCHSFQSLFFVLIHIWALNFRFEIRDSRTVRFFSVSRTNCHDFPFHWPS